MVSQNDTNWKKSENRQDWSEKDKKGKRKVVNNDKNKK